MKLPPHRPGVDHEVNLQPDKNGNEPPLPWGPLYNMSREELLVLRKTLKDLLDRGFIRASSSAAAAPVLFVRKPNGGLRFCCDYRALNAITKRDRYPLPLIAETLQNLAKAKWFTKLDVVAAFHKIRMAPGHEERLHFARAYLDDVLIYSSGSKADHEAKVRRVLQALADAGLHLDPAKKGIACDPEKQRAIREWEAPTTVKGVRSFLGFANYYRIFIPDYAKITQSLDALLKKGTAFHWGRAENEAFQELKRRFCESPVLKQWDPSLPTFLETDCSGYALGGVLSQEGPDGRRHACAFFSKRLSPAEYNYPIHDKEMLAIMRCLDNWNAELRSCGPFTILTDHRNLEYFATRQKLTERQSRWAAELSQFDFKLEYRPGSEAVVPDALSRREQDKPQGIDDEREQGRMIQLIPDSAIPSSTRACINAMSSDCSEASTLPKMKVFEVADLQQLWDETVAKDSIFRAAYKAVRDRERAFPPSLGLKIQISECTLAIVARRFYWPGQSQLVRRRKGFLKPLPIPDRPRSHLSMDFITDLPPTGPSKARYLWVIVDRLTKAVTLEVMDNMEAEPCANRFLQCHYRFHGMPRSIVSDRGSNWLSRFWKRFCRLAGVTQKLSTAYHPQTDGGPERMNQEIEAYLRAYVSDQDQPLFR
ncbi:integrase core domain-containing protein [Hirsutella rhossiliensis]